MSPVWHILVVATVVALVFATRRGVRPKHNGGRPAAIDGDAAVLQQLQVAGSDLARPHEIEFFLYLPSEAAAESAAATLRTRGFSSEASRSKDATAWLCLAKRNMIPTHADLSRLRAELDSLARSLGGEYDGWGCEVVK